jgi:glycosyltransferase involved in cell wall biosynthesis
MEPLISVIILTYNQDKYIAQAIESVINQDVNFEYEIIIGEDCSVDDTFQIVLSFKNKYPEKIKLVTSELNVGLVKNYRRCLLECRGKYITALGGDDFWHSDQKLSIQVRFLESNPDFGLVHCGVTRFYENLGMKQNSCDVSKNIPNGYVYDYLLKENFIFAPTACFRKSLLAYIDFELYEKLGFFIEDYPMWLEFSQHSKINYINQSLVTYRISDGSISRSLDFAKQLHYLENSLEIKKYFLKKYPSKYIKISDLIELQNKIYFNQSLQYKDYRRAKKYAKLLNFNSFKQVIFISSLGCNIYSKWIEFKQSKNFTIIQRKVD